MRYFLTPEGNVDRNSPVELPVDRDLPPQIVRFHYDGVIRLVQVITVKPTRSERWPVLLLGNELWNSRDGVHDEGVVKTYSLTKVYELTNQ